MLDRRAAMKKLGAGTAIALGASTVLSTRDVAYAASNCLDRTSLPSGDLVPELAVTTPGGTMQFTINDTPVCTCGSISTTYQWNQPVNLSVPSGAVRSVRLTSSGRTAVVTGFNNGGRQKPFEPGTTFDIDVMITWECHGDVEVRNFRIFAAYPSGTTSTELT